MRSIYNRAFLERRASREGLDKALRVSSPLSWIGLAAVAVMLLAAVGWSFLDRLPITVTAAGYLVEPSVGTLTVTAPAGGEVVAVLVREGDEVTADTPVLTLRRGGEETTLPAGQSGLVRGVTVKEGDSLAARDDVLRLSPAIPEGMSRQWVLVTFVSGTDAMRINEKLNQGQEVWVRMTAASSDGGSRGYAEGRVLGVDGYVTSDLSLQAMLGAHNRLSGQITGEGGALYAVTCCLREDPGSANGLRWSGASGASQPLLAGLEYSVRLILDEERPIDALVKGLRGEAQ